MSKEERKEPEFDWSMIGDIEKGRPNLGPDMKVSVYRLLQFTLRDILIQKFGVEETDRVFFEAGKRAGSEYYKNIITEKSNFNDFLNDLQDTLKNLNIGILRIEYADLKKMVFTLTIAEDLDCSGVPESGETLCTYDEGFIAGLLHAHTGWEFVVKEVDCWGLGDTICRFNAKPLKSIFKEHA